MKCMDERTNLKILLEFSPPSNVIFLNSCKDWIHTLTSNLDILCNYNLMPSKSNLGDWSKIYAQYSLLKKPKELLHPLTSKCWMGVEQNWEWCIIKCHFYKKFIPTKKMQTWFLKMIHSIKFPINSLRSPFNEFRSS